MQHRSVPALSAGLLLYRFDAGHSLEVLLAHPGGPFWARKDTGTWSVPKGEYEPGEDAQSAALREFGEETGFDVPDGDLQPLGEVTQRSGKRVTAWALQGDADPAAAVSNSFEMEWPRGSGRIEEFPEVDRVEWMAIDAARSRIVPAQEEFLDRLVRLVAVGGH